MTPDDFWPGPYTTLTPHYLGRIKNQLVELRADYQNLVAQQDLALGYNFDALLWICAVVFWNLRVIAHDAPRDAAPTPVDQDMKDTLAKLAVEFQSVLGGDPPDFLAEIPILPDPDWDAVFKDHFNLLDSAISTFILWDTPCHNYDLAGANAPQPTFETLRKLILQFNTWPCTKNYYTQFMHKLDSSRSGTCYATHWMARVEQAAQEPPKPAAKRKVNDVDPPSWAAQGLGRPDIDQTVNSSSYRVKGDEFFYKKRLISDIRRWPEWRLKENPIIASLLDLDSGSV
jgi:hypothetical protein